MLKKISSAVRYASVIIGFIVAIIGSICEMPLLIVIGVAITLLASISVLA